MIYYFFVLVIGNVAASSSTINQKFFRYMPRRGPLKEAVNVRYTFKHAPQQARGTIVCIHGFGSNADQFRKQLPFMADAGYDCYAMDLMGYGYSDKPSPRQYDVNSLYNMENWADQTACFIEEVVQKKEPVFLVCNSIGGVVGLETAVENPKLVKGVVLIDISMRNLHVKKQPPLMRPFTSLLQTLLRETNVGEAFFNNVATPSFLRPILAQAYACKTPADLDEETLQIILKPGLLPGAAEVFLDFISYSGGPLPEELLPKVKCPVRILHGSRDPWEPIDQARELANFSSVDEFVEIPDGGHVPIDCPRTIDFVNKEILKFVDKY